MGILARVGLKLAIGIDLLKLFNYTLFLMNNAFFQLSLSVA